MKQFLLISAVCMITLTSCNIFDSDKKSDKKDSEKVNDIAISEVTVPDFIKNGTTANIEITVQNHGNTDVDDPFEVTITNETEGADLGSETITGISRSESTTISIPWNTSEAVLGEHSLLIHHNYEDDDAENNSFRDTTFVNERAEFDVAVNRIIAPAFVTQGDVVTIEVALLNVGFEDIAGTIGSTLHDVTNDVTIRTQSIEGLNRDEEKIISYTWDTGNTSAGEHTLSAWHNYSDDNTVNDSDSLQITVNEKMESDIAIAQITATDSAISGETVSIEVTIDNAGETDIEDDITVTLTDETDGIIIDSQIINGLDTGSQTMLTFSWDTDGASEGEHTLTASHDFEDDNSDNNAHSTITKVRLPITDLTIYDIQSESNVTRGDTAFIHVVLFNIGDLNVFSDFDIVLTHHGVEEDRLTLFGGLSAGDSTTVILEWDTANETTGPPPHPLIITHTFEDDNMVNNSDSTYIQVDLNN